MYICCYCTIQSDLFDFANQFFKISRWPNFTFVSAFYVGSSSFENMMVLNLSDQEKSFKNHLIQTKIQLNYFHSFVGDTFS